MFKDVEVNQKVIVFQLMDEAYAISVYHIGSIEQMLPITRVPQTARYVKGVINLRGVVTPIIDLRTQFGMPEKTYDTQTRIIIVTLDDIDVGLIVDEAKDVLDIPNANIEPPPEVIDMETSAYIAGVAKMNNQLINILDLTHILSVADLEEWRQKEQINGTK